MELILEDDSLHDDVLSQLERLELVADRPLIVSDADEVIFAFVRSLEGFLLDNGHFMDLQSFALSGNIRDSVTREPVSAEMVKKLIGEFFAERTEDMEPVDHAVDTLVALSERAQILVLSNVPLDQKDARRRALVKNHMDYPLVANIGRKGGAMAYLAERHNAPIFFLDDIPHNISSVARAAGSVTCIHFIADHRLRNLLGQAEDADVRIDDWPGVREFIEARLSESGF
jgi:hypothetical protein